MKRAKSALAAEAREKTRVLLRAPVELRRFGRSRWEYQGVTTDRSAGGVGVDVNAVFAVGEVVELRFPVDDQGAHHRVRVVYRNNQHHYGMQFLD